MKKLLLGLALVFAFATVDAQNVRKLDHNYYLAGLPAKKIEYYAVKDRQKQENWCWAACIQTVLNYHGLNVSQEQIVDRSYGRLVDAPGGPYEMMRSLNGVIQTGDDYKLVTAEFNSTNANEIRDHMANDEPMIVGLKQPGSRIGHAFVLSGIYYQQDRRGNVYPDKVVLRDPWPNAASRKEMMWADFVRSVNAIYEVDVQDYTYTLTRN